MRRMYGIGSRASFIGHHLSSWPSELSLPSHSIRHSRGRPLYYLCSFSVPIARRSSTPSPMIQISPGRGGWNEQLIAKTVRSAEEDFSGFKLSLRQMETVLRRLQEAVGWRDDWHHNPFMSHLNVSISAFEIFRSSEFDRSHCQMF